MRNLRCLALAWHLVWYSESAGAEEWVLVVPSPVQVWNSRHKKKADLKNHTLKAVSAPFRIELFLTGDSEEVKHSTWRGQVPVYAVCQGKLDERQFASPFVHTRFQMSMARLLQLSYTADLFSLTRLPQCIDTSVDDSAS